MKLYKAVDHYIDASEIIGMTDSDGDNVTLLLLTTDEAGKNEMISLPREIIQHKEPERGDFLVVNENNQAFIMPGEAFLDAFSPCNEDEPMSFSAALLHLKQGRRLTRRGWNGQNIFVFMVDGSNFQVNRPPLLGIFDEGTEIDYRPHLDMRYADGSIGVWLASMSDILMNDWELLPK